MKHKSLEKLLFKLANPICYTILAGIGTHAVYNFIRGEYKIALAETGMVAISSLMMYLNKKDIEGHDFVIKLCDDIEEFKKKQSKENKGVIPERTDEWKLDTSSYDGWLNQE
jgi:hypothetical protein